MTSDQLQKPCLFLGRALNLQEFPKELEWKQPVDIDDSSKLQIQIQLLDQSKIDRVVLIRTTRDKSKADAARYVLRNSWRFGCGV